MGFFRQKGKNNGNGPALADAPPAPAESAPDESIRAFEPAYKMWGPRLLNMVAELGSISEETESEFLSIGMKLSSFSKGCSENSNQASYIVKMIEGGSGLNISKFKDLFEQAHNKVGSCADIISNGVVGMRELKSRIDNILELRAFLKKLAHSISVLGTLMRIEVARVGEDEFTVMTSAIDTLARDIDKENIEIETYAKTAKAGLTSSSERMAASTKKFVGDLTISREHIQEILEEMDRMIVQAKAACKRIEGRASQISPAIGSVVSALQYHDICRQQMEHIGEVLKNMAGKISGLDAMEAGEKVSFRRWTVEALYIQISQLENVIAETSASAEGVSGHLTRISDLAEAQAEDAGMILEEEESGSHRIAKIGSELELLSGMLAENKAIVLELNTAISEVADTIGNLSRQVANIELISEDISLLALNTIVKVSRTGNEGRGLEVLAGEIRKLSANANDQIAKGAEVIKNILAASSEFKRTVSGELDRELASTDEIFRQTHDSAQELLDTDTSLMKALGVISENTKALEAEIAQIVSGIRFDSLIKSRLGAMASDLRSMLGEIGADAPSASGGGGGREEASSEFHDLTNRYTMHSEREVHEAALNSIKGNGSPGEQGVAAHSGLGDNVELF